MRIDLSGVVVVVGGCLRTIFGPVRLQQSLGNHGKVQVTRESRFCAGRHRQSTNQRKLLPHEGGAGLHEIQRQTQSLGDRARIL